MLHNIHQMTVKFAVTYKQRSIETPAPSLCILPFSCRSCGLVSRLARFGVAEENESKQVMLLPNVTSLLLPNVTSLLLPNVTSQCYFHDQEHYSHYHLSHHPHLLSPRHRMHSRSTPSTSFVCVYSIDILVVL